MCETLVAVGQGAGWRSLTGGIARAFNFTSATLSVQILQQLLAGRNLVPVSLAAEGCAAYQGIGWLFRQPVS